MNCSFVAVNYHHRLVDFYKRRKLYAIPFIRNVLFVSITLGLLTALTISTVSTDTNHSFFDAWKQVPNGPERRHRRFNTVYASLCGSINFLPYLANWTVSYYQRSPNVEQRLKGLIDITSVSHSECAHTTLLQFAWKPYFMQQHPLSFRDGTDNVYFASFLDSESECTIVNTGTFHCVMDCGSDSTLTFAV